MEVRDSYDTINGLDNRIKFENGLEIIAEDGRPLFEIKLLPGGNGVEISTNMCVKVNDEVLERYISTT